MTERTAARLAGAAGFLVVATFVAGKTARDATLLAAFSVGLLPTFVGASALATLPLVLSVGRRMTGLGPARLVPALYATNAALLVVEWLAGTRWPHVTAGIAYLHLAALGPILVSGFWSIVNERFDPRAAKRYIGGIGLGATLGGIAGGLVAQATAAWLPPGAILLVVAAMHAACVVLLRVLARREASTAPAPSDAPSDAWEGLRVVARSPLLRSVSAMAVLLAMAAAALDYVFKAQIAHSARGPLGALAIYYTITNVATAAAQLLLADRAMGKIGVGRAVAILPATLAGVAAAAAAAPALLVIAIARGAEMVARSSVYRAASELLLAPLLPRDKRAAKVIVDVGADRIGDLLGAQLVGALLIALPSGIPVAAVVLALGALLLAFAVPRAYRRTLAERLVATATPPETLALKDSLQLAPPAPAPAHAPVLAPAHAPVLDAAPPPHDEMLATIADLRSGDRARVERRLAEPLSTELAPYALPLVAWPPTAALAARRLRELAPKITGLLVDALLDADTEFAVRRKLPSIIEAGDAGLAALGLWRALDDARFEVRYRAGKALARLRAAGRALPATPEQIFEAVEREVRVDTRIWRSHRLLDGFEGSEADVRIAHALEQRSATALEHVFTLLGLVLPAEPVRVALQALGTGDAALRGTALEYLEGVLPHRLRDRLWPFLELDDRGRAAARSPHELVSELELAHPSIVEGLRTPS